MGNAAKKLQDEKINSNLSVVKTDSKEEPAKILTIVDKINKVENLKILVDKREVLQQSKRKLEKFVLGADGQTEFLTLKDTNSQVFQTSNKDAVNAVIEVLMKQLSESIKKVESEIEF